MTNQLDRIKKRLRAEAKGRRAAAAGPAAAGLLARRLLAAFDGGAIPLAGGAAVSAYWPKGDELDPRPVMAALAERGHEIGLPLVTAPATPLSFRRWRPGDRLEPAGFGLEVPAESQPEVVPALLLVPLLAFDRKGTRLGYGGGFYDRTLAALRARGPAPAVGLAYAGQEFPDLPCTPTDLPMDWIVTEAEVLAIGPGTP
jgi:5-formyltetrahydrofolate cyclo-ligase